MKSFMFVILAIFGSLITSSYSHIIPPNQSLAPSKLLLGRDTNGLQENVTWDKYSMSVNGKRLYVYSGEFHPWRLPVIDLWLDILHKLKALGYNAVSVYVHWGLVEAEQGVFNFNGIFDWEPFFDAIKKVGLYVIVRPGPYINAELSAGGFPGWRQHAPEGIYWRVSNEAYYKQITPYINEISQRLAPHQITNGGPIILLQLENELSAAAAPGYDWPANQYMGYLRETFINAGINVPLIHNDVAHSGYYATSGVIDIYTYDTYPITCSNWNGALSQGDWDKHLSFAPGHPHFLGENGGGFYAQWTDTNNNCPSFMDPFVFRLMYKNQYSMSVTAMNIYMIYGGTNWGHLSFHRTPTTYDFVTAISEDRSITREKYSEMKLQAHLFAVSPAFLTTRLLVKSTNSYTSNTEVVVSCTKDEIGNKTAFWTVRHSSPLSANISQFNLTIPTSKGEITIPQLSGTLTLPGKDSRIYLTDYELGPHNMLYSSAELFTWQKIDDTYVAVLYGSPGEIHETAFTFSGKAPNITVLEGNALLDKRISNDTAILNYNSTGQSVVSIGPDIKLYLLDKFEAYKLWVPALSCGGEGNVIVKGPYLVRNACIIGSTLHVSGDTNSTVPVEVIASSKVSSVKWNDEEISTTRSATGSLVGLIKFASPEVDIPVLSELEWKSIDSLPEVTSGYDDSKWVDASNTTTVNGVRNLTTPTDLYSGTYGFHTGYILYRGHFTATGNETEFYTEMLGGRGFGYSVWLNDIFIGSNTGSASNHGGQSTFTFSQLAAGTENVVTIIYQQMGYNENESGGITNPRGIWNYNFGSATPAVTWKIQGNHGGENYADKARGPYNEGGTYAERKGFHQPGVDTTSWPTLSPFKGTETAGVQFYTTEFELKLPPGYDIPLSFNLTASADSRVLFFVNGYQFGRYIANYGPQNLFPVPEGILNYQGENTVSMVIWAQGKAGAHISEFSIVKTGVYQTGLGKIRSSPQPRYLERGGFLV